MKKPAQTRLLVLKSYDQNFREISELMEYLSCLDVLNYSTRSSNSLGFNGDASAQPELMILFMDKKMSFDVHLSANAFLLKSPNFGPRRLSNFRFYCIDVLGEPKANILELLAECVSTQMKVHPSMN
ncbi:MAG: hypothetical protein O2984_06775 [Bacteroidetes bacterium]|nr:hypothetical protein [Bacteroidota bacterium]